METRPLSLVDPIYATKQTTMHKGLTFIGILLCLLGGSTGYAQHYIGVRGGWGGGSARFTPQQESAMQWGLYSGGVSYKFFSDIKYVGAIQLDLQYIGKGYVTLERKNADTSYHRTINSFELPFMWQPHFYFFQRHARFFLNLGVQFSYNMDSKQWYESKQQGVYDEKIYPMKLVRDVRFGYGLCGGAGISILAGRWDITLEARYNFGYSDILRSKIKYEPNLYTQSPLDNLNFSLGIYYRLGKEGLRAAPSKRMAAKIAEAEARRIIRRREKQGLPPIDSSLMRAIDEILSRPLLLEPEESQPSSEESSLTPDSSQPVQAALRSVSGETSPLKVNARPTSDLITPRKTVSSTPYRATEERSFTGQFSGAISSSKG